MKIAKAHCFFEQSGTFRDAFRKNGVDAECYDIDNHFGKTDHVIDLFGEITTAYGGGASVFDNVGKDDLVMAFFPCIRFSDQAQFLFQGTNYGQQNWPIVRKLENDLNLHRELNELYSLITKMAIICLERNIRLVIENPYSTKHYLLNYWALKPSVIDHDRAMNGDYYKKPTQFFFIGCEPEQNFLFEPISWTETKNVRKESKIERSMIHPQYADRFLRTYVLDQEEKTNA